LLANHNSIEGRLCPLLADLFRKPVAPSGLLAPYDAALAAQKAAADRVVVIEGDEESASLMRWLNEQPARSVIYVAFGSEAPLSADHVRELALRLELAGARFLWALRERTARCSPTGSRSAWPGTAWCASDGCRRCASRRTARWARS
jgi:hypothetical protein